MKFTLAAIVGLLAALDGVSAFSPKGYVPSKSGLMVPSSSSSSSSTTTSTTAVPGDNNGSNNSPLWRSGMQMVAGGAERSYGQEYYEG